MRGASRLRRPAGSSVAERRHVLRPRPFLVAAVGALGVAATGRPSIPPLDRFGPGASLGALVAAPDERLPDLRQRARDCDRDAEAWREAGAADDEPARTTTTPSARPSVRPSVGPSVFASPLPC